MNRGFHTALLLLTLLGAGLRLYKLGDYPAGFGQDEAVVLYDAWSLLTTGTDHHGARWPLNAREFGDFPSALPSYEIIPFVALMGPSELAIRLPCALFNIAAIPLFGLLMVHLFRSRAAGLFAAALLAVSPWNIFFSRWAVSPGFVTFFQVAGLYLLIRLLSRQEHRMRVYGAAILTGFMLFLWTHQYLSQYFFAPLMIATAFLLWNRSNWPKILVTGGMYSLAMLLAIATRSQNPSTIGRLHKECIFFTDQVWSNFWHNYWDYQSLTYLFHAPPMLPLHQIPGIAHIQHSLAPLYLIGLVTLVGAAIAPRRLMAWLGLHHDGDEPSHWRKAALWVIAGVLLAPIVGALFTERMYTARMTHLLTQALMVTSLGCAAVWHALRRLPLKAAAPVFALAVGIYLGQSIVKTSHGLARNNLFFKTYLQQGVPDTLRYLARQTDVRSVRMPHMLQGYIYHLLFTPVPPASVNHTEVSPPFPNPNERWYYDRILRIGNYVFEQDLDGSAIAKTHTLRHQVRDNDQIWYDLYEHTGDWVVLRHEDLKP